MHAKVRRGSVAGYATDGKDKEIIYKVIISVNFEQLLKN